MQWQMLPQRHDITFVKKVYIALSTDRLTSFIAMKPWFLKVLRYYN